MAAVMISFSVTLNSFLSLATAAIAVHKIAPQLLLPTHNVKGDLGVPGVIAVPDEHGHIFPHALRSEGCLHKICAQAFKGDWE